MKGIEHFRELARRAEKRRRVWETVPPRSKVMFLGMVFCLFAAIGILGQLDSQTASRVKLLVAAVFTGGFAVTYAWVAIQRTFLWFVLLVPLQLIAAPLVFSYVRRHSPGGMAIPEALRPLLTTDSTASVILISAGYVLLMSFIAREGERFFRTHTEIQLAGEIHKALVAPIHRRSAGYEFYGMSLASGTVGGDLVDVVERDEHWVAYVADVAGHGVSSGVLMAMLKSATSMSVRFDPKADSLLAGINDVLCSLKAGSMYATFAFLAWSAERGLRYSLAGHLPILFCRREKVQLLSAQNLPVGLFSDASFESMAIDVQPGDLFAILTDGLTEAVDSKGEELGMEAIATMLPRLKDAPLEEIAAAILERVRKHGASHDDQSLLLVRKLQ